MNDAKNILPGIQLFISRIVFQFAWSIMNTICHGEKK